MRTQVKVGWYGLRGIAVRTTDPGTGIVTVGPSVRFTAPEAYEQQEDDDPKAFTDKCDVWSFGVLVRMASFCFGGVPGNLRLYLTPIG